ncbi:MAG: IS1634 family transposase [Bacillota bacterium]|nr:IS1634 family transposase [Bacillota bacterium]
MTIPLIIALANHILTEIRFVERIDEGVSWDRSQWKVSPGMLAKAMVLATFSDMRAPLVHVGSRFNGMDTDYLFGEGIRSEDINEYNLGQMLDRMSENSCNAWYRSIALTVGTIYKIIITRLHADTTTISFYGEYDVDLSLFNAGERANMLAIDRGYNKDGRPQCNQVVVGQIVNEDGIVLVSEALDGHTSDIEWNRQAIRYARDIQQDMAQTGVFVADSKLICEEHFRTLMDPEKWVEFVSRCPANFSNKLESRMIQKAYAQETWQELGSYHEGKSAAVYQGIGFEEVVYGYPTRLLVVRSSALASKADQQMKKNRIEVDELVKELEKKTFKCLPDVEVEWLRFSHHKSTRLFTCRYETDCQSQEKWLRGRHGPDTKPIGMRHVHHRISAIQQT